MRTYETVHMKHLNKHLSLKGGQYTVIVTITIFLFLLGFRAVRNGKSGLLA